jgi:hypothetical protein
MENGKTMTQNGSDSFKERWNERKEQLSFWMRSRIPITARTLPVVHFQQIYLFEAS